MNSFDVFVIKGFTVQKEPERKRKKTVKKYLSV